MEAGTPLFPDIAGERMRRTIRALNSAHAETPLPHMKLHDLRHIHTSLLLEAGVPVHVVAARLGHADPAITLRVYAHVVRDQASEVAQLLPRRWRSQPWKTPCVINAVGNGPGGRRSRRPIWR